MEYIIITLALFVIVGQYYSFKHKPIIKYIKSESIIGKQYISYDNSFCVCIDSCESYKYADKHDKYLAGTAEDGTRIVCDILTEPFITGRYFLGKYYKDDYTMIIVRDRVYNLTHLVMFQQRGIKTIDKSIKTVDSFNLYLEY